MASEYYIAHNTQTDEYLAEKLFRGFYMTVDVTSAIKCKDEMELRRKIEKANVDYKSMLQIETITVY
ncbi:MAG: hypothetical protein PUE21_01090 [Lachnospiraceae bacterium]|nr:hypothetical protein [Lachnospiraceae bacterium]